jgi:hypothetical protein
MTRWALLLVAATLAGGCDAVLQPSAMVAQRTLAWKDVATPTDRARLRDWRSSFVAALGAARRAGHAADIAREGALLDPDAAIGGAIPDGTYRCRVIKLGAKAKGLLDYVAYPNFGCRVRSRSSGQRLDKIGGSQRYVGLVFPNDAIRQVFLGTLVLGDESRAMQYGQDADRDVAGFVERIGPARWRLIMPKPSFESQFDVLELIPQS